MPSNDAQNVSFISLSRLGWPLALSAIAYACFTRQAPLTNALLSWWPMQVWGKLAFGAYVSHPILRYQPSVPSPTPGRGVGWVEEERTGWRAWRAVMVLCTQSRGVRLAR
jgi:hypothetical protein